MTTTDFFLRASSALSARAHCDLPEPPFCPHGTYFAEKSKLSSAIEASHLDDRRAELRREVNQLRAAGAGEAADPQASLLARLLPTNIGVSRVQLALNIFFAVLVEFGAAFGLYIGHAPWRLRAPRDGTAAERSLGA